MRISAIITRIIQQMKRDRRTLALLFLAPLLVLSLMYFIFNSNEASVTLVVSNAPAPLIDKLKETDFTIIVDNDFSKKQLQDKEYNGWLAVEQNVSKLTLLNDDPSLAKALTMQLAQILQPTQASIGSMKTDYVYGDQDTAIFDIFSPMLIGFFVFSLFF